MEQLLRARGAAGRLKLVAEDGGGGWRVAAGAWWRDDAWALKAIRWKLHTFQGDVESVERMMCEIGEEHAAEAEYFSEVGGEVGAGRRTRRRVSCGRSEVQCAKDVGQGKSCARARPAPAVGCAGSSILPQLHPRVIGRKITHACPRMSVPSTPYSLFHSVTDYLKPLHSKPFHFFLEITAISQY